jgi:flagellar motility protein MotE (MotC chaperone)
MTRTYITLAAAAALAALPALPSAAGAQFGALKRAVAGKVADKAADRAVDKAAEKGGVELSAPRPAPKFTDRLIEITPERVDRLLKGLAAERAAMGGLRRDVAARQAAYAAYEKKKAEWDACRDRTEAAQKRDVRSRDAEIQKVAERMKAAAMANDMKEMMRLQDSLQKGETGRMQQMDTCGAEPRNPGSAPEAHYAEREVATQADSVGASAAGLTIGQYGVMRERAAAFVMTAGKFEGSHNRLWAYTAGELEALRARAADLEAHREQLERNESWDIDPTRRR